MPAERRRVLRKFYANGCRLSYALVLLTGTLFITDHGLLHHLYLSLVQRVWHFRPYEWHFRYESDVFFLFNAELRIAWAAAEDSISVSRSDVVSSARWTYSNSGVYRFVNFVKPFFARNLTHSSPQKKRKKAVRNKRSTTVKSSKCKTRLVCLKLISFFSACFEVETTPCSNGSMARSVSLSSSLSNNLSSQHYSRQRNQMSPFPLSSHTQGNHPRKRS